MASKHVNAVVVGAGAGGGIVAKELSTAGLSVVLLERGKWHNAFDCRKDDLRNQRTWVLGNAFGPDENRNPRVFVDLEGRDRVVLPSDNSYNNNAACVGGGTFSYGAMAWRYGLALHGARLPYALDLRRSRRQHLGRLADQLSGPGTLLRESGVGDRSLGRRLKQHLSRAAPTPAAHAAASG
jgi:choline dehydrogenase-like flavoprotein